MPLVVSRPEIRSPRTALTLILAAATAPVVVSAAVGQNWPVFAVALVAGGSGAVLGWVRHRAFRPGDAAAVAAVAAVTALVQPAMGLWTLLGGLCAASLLRARGIGMPWLSWRRRGRWWIGLLIAFAVGLALSAVNLALSRSPGDPDTIGRRLDGLLDAVKAGLSEELGMRLCLLAFCVYALGRLPRTRVENVLTYLVLVVPHAAIHFTLRPELLVSGTISLGLLFGLPLAFLLKRFGLVPAITAHVVIDAVRYLAVGV